MQMMWWLGVAAVSAEEPSCRHSLIQNHLDLAHGFYAMRESLPRYDREDPVRNYPEEPPVGRVLRAEVEAAMDFVCPEAIALELLLHSERHLSLLSRTTQPEELWSNATEACGSFEGFKKVFQQIPAWNPEHADIVDHGLQHLLRTWHRIGLDPAKFCPRIAAAPTRGRLPWALGEVEVHLDCAMRSEEGFEVIPGDFSKRCKSDNLWERLPPALRQVLAEKRPAEKRGRSGGACGRHHVFKGYLSTAQWQSPSRIMGSVSCESPFVTYHAFPMLPLTLCKYCSVGSLLRLQPGDRVLEFGPGCGFAAATLMAAFGVKVTVLEAMSDHLAGAPRAAAEVGVEFEALCQGDVAGLAAFADGSFDAIVVNGAFQTLRSAAAMCVVLRWLIRKLRPGGAMWVGQLYDPFFVLDFPPEDQETCMQQAMATEKIVYAYLQEMELFGVAESFSTDARSLFVSKLPAASSDEDDTWKEIDRETQRAASMYGCSEVSSEPPSSSSTEIVDALRSSWMSPLELQSFRAGASFLGCAQPGMASRGRELRSGVWIIEAFTSPAEARHVRGLLDDLATTPPSRQDTWVDDLLIPTATDLVLDELEMRLDALGLPRSHSQPWHLLRYGSGFAGSGPVTACQVEAQDQDQEEHVTVVIWISDCWDGISPCQAADAGPNLHDGAALFPELQLRVRAPAGGLLVYPRKGGCHLIAGLSSEAPAQVLLQKTYYAQPVEMKLPEVPNFCHTGDAAGHCTQYHLTPDSHGSDRVQRALSELMRAAAAHAGEASALAASREAAELLEALGLQVSGQSLGECPHWHAMEALSNVQMLAAQAVGLDERSPGLLAAAVRRCPGCVGPLQSLVPMLLFRAKDLLVQSQPEKARELLLQAVSYLHRMALMGLGGIETFARLADQLLEEVKTASSGATQT